MAAKKAVLSGKIVTFGMNGLEASMCPRAGPYVTAIHLQIDRNLDSTGDIASGGRLCCFRNAFVNQKLQNRRFNPEFIM